MNYYYSGQGSLYAAKRDAATGKPLGFSPVGNVPELTLDIEISKYEHKESESGNRALDLTLVKEKKGKFKIKMESVSLDNLAIGLYGESTVVAGATVTNEIVKFYKGKRMPLANPNVSAVTITSPAAATFANNAVLAVDALVVPIAGNGHYYKVTVAGTTAATGNPTWPTNGTTVTSGTVTFQDMGTNAVTLNTDYTVDAKNGSLIFPATGSAMAEGAPLSVSYTYGGYANLEAFTQAVSPERYLRFEGLNTVDGSAVIIDMYRAQFDPLSGLGLINEEIAAIDMSGSLLADAFVQTGSKFFRERIVSV